MRMKGKDYSDPGMYFITFNTKDWVHWFGEIKEGQIYYSEIGILAKKIIENIPQHFKNTIIDTYVIMPDHIHAIIEILPAVPPVPSPHGAMPQAENSLMPQAEKEINPHHNPQWKKGTIGVIINQFKSSVTREIRKQNPNSTFAWQSKFHDHILRCWDIERVRNYINNNIQNWEKKKKK